MGAAFFLCGCQSDFSPLPGRDVRSYQSILEWTHSNGMPGTVLLVKSPTVNFIGSIGLADVDRGVPMRADHAFRIGSVTKTFLGIVAAQMQAEGKLHSEEFLGAYLPDSITDRIQFSDRISVRHLLRHQSGIYGFDDDWKYEVSRWLLHRYEPWPPLRMLEFSFDRPARFEPGDAFSYSNPNYILLGMIVDRVTGGHHSAEIRKRILEPLNLKSTYYELNEGARGELAHGYEHLHGFRDTRDWTPVTGGSAGLVSTVSDLAVFIRAVVGTNSFLDEGTRRVLKAEPEPGLHLAEAAGRPVVRYDFGVDPQRAKTGLPWFYGHRGVSAGYICGAWHEPKNDITIVYFGNSAQFQIFNSMKRSWRFFGRLEEALIEQALADVNGGVRPAALADYTERKGSDLQGAWTGILGSGLWPFSSLRLNVRITEPPAGNFVGELDIVEEAANCQPLLVSYKQPNVELAIRSGAGKFEGKLNSTRTEMTGRWIQAGRATRMTFKRTTGQVLTPAFER